MENNKLSDVNSKSGSELIAIAHGIAANFESPATELLRELASRLECSIIRGDELQQKLDAMAAENARLKSFITKNCFVEDDGSDYGFGDASISMPPTPATDAYMNSVRAESWADALIMVKSAIFTDSLDHIDFLFNGKIEQLRSGNHDTADKAGAK